MRRFIDVIFIDPKVKRFVVLHQGKFWQLPRLNLAMSSWLLKQPYKGNLSDIFVAKDQAVACPKLATTLATYELPEQLHGMDANRFLAWWEMNDYKWLSTQNVLTLGDDNTLSGEPPAGVKIAVTVGSAQSTTDNQVIHSQIIATNPTQTQKDDVIDLTPPNMDKETLAHASVAITQATILPKPLDVSASAPSVPIASTPMATQTNLQPEPQVPSQAPINPPSQPSTPIPSPKGVGDLDFFDNLLSELNEEVSHPH